MSNKVYDYRYNAQFERYIQQFMRAFSGFQVQDGVDRSGDGEGEQERVPVIYGNMSRVVASVLNNRDSFTNQKLPIMAANLSGIERDTERNRSPYHIDEVSNHRLVPEDPKTVRRILGPSFTMNMDLSIYASSTTQLFSILEQILLIFNPRITIQVDVDGYNPDYISEIILSGIQNEINYPMGESSNTVMMTLSFRVPVRLGYPREMAGGIIKEIIATVYDDAPDEAIELEKMVINGDSQ